MPFIIFLHPEKFIILKSFYIIVKKLNQGYVFSSSHVWMWKLDYKESWTPKNWCFWIVVLEKTLKSPLDCKEIQPVHPKGNQSWMFIVRTDVEAEAPINCPPDAKSWLIWKAPDAGKDWRREERGRQRWDGWMTPLTQWAWVWVNSGSWWWTGRPGVLQSMGSQRIGHDWAMKKMGIPDHLICLLRNLYAGQEATVRTGHGTTDWFNRKRSSSRLYIVTLFI